MSELLVSSLACKEVEICLSHSQNKKNKTEQNENQSLFRFIRELISQDKLLPQTGRNGLIEMEDHNLPEWKAMSRNLHRNQSGEKKKKTKHLMMTTQKLSVDKFKSLIFQRAQHQWVVRELGFTSRSSIMFSQSRPENSPFMLLVRQEIK